MSDQPSDTYFAALPPEEICIELEHRVERFYGFLNSSGVYIRLHKSFRTYYGLSGSPGVATTWELNRGGDNDELIFVRVNHYRNIAKHILNMVAGSKLAFQPVAINSDSESMQAQDLASGLLDYYARDKQMDKIIRKTVEMAILFAEGYLAVEWDPTAGGTFSANPDGSRVAEGDVRFTPLSPLDVVKDPYKESHEDCDWLMIRSFRSRFELAAQYPDKAEDILKLETKSQGKNRIRLGNMTEHSDDVPVYTFYHKKSNALPDGRQVIFCSGNVSLYDSSLPYPEIPVYRVAPSDLFGSPYGYSIMFDLLGIQQAIDALYSAVTNNQIAFGVQNIIAPKGHDLNAEALTGGLNLITYDSKLGKPEALNLTSTPREIFDFIKQLEAVMEVLSGINSTVRGDPQASLESGSALALVQSQAVQFQSDLQAAYANFVSDVGTALLQRLKAFCPMPRKALIIGKYKRHEATTFTGEDLDRIERVQVELGNAFSKMPSGRIDIARDLLQNNMIKRPEEYLSVVMTGNLEPMIEGDRAELMLIRSENEMLAEGAQIPVTLVDSHALHIREHRCVLASPEARSNPGIVNAALGHIQEHINALRTADPALLAMLGEQSLMPPPPMPGAAPGGPPDSGKKPPPEKASGPGPAKGGQMPNLPTNPATGQTWDASSGGGMVPPQGAV